MSLPNRKPKYLHAVSRRSGLRRPDLHRLGGVALALGLALLLGACADKPRVKPALAAAPVDMSGDWELDYGRSDNLQANFNSMLRTARERAARTSGDNNRGAAINANSSQEAIISLARMAELITESQLLEVEQDRVSIRVEREGNFSLSCDYGPNAVQEIDYGIGNESCFWDGEQLVFQIRLPDGLDIVHRLSVSTTGQTLAIVTTLYSSSAPGPFSLRRIYTRYVPGASGYRCVETLTRGRVCTTESN